MTKKILIVTYFYPPNGGVGSFRIMKFIKYLPEFGWDASAVTVKDSSDSASGENDFSDALEKVDNIYRTPILSLNVERAPGLRWAPHLVKKLTTIVEENDIDVIMYSGPPFYQSIVAPIIKKYSNIPYIIDYRDPWGVPPYSLYNDTSGILRKAKNVYLPTFCETIILNSADAIITASQVVTSRYEEKYGLDNILTIPNGFDPDDYSFDSITTSDNFQIVYAGKFLDFREYQPTFEAFRELLKEYPNAKFVHLGPKEDHVFKTISDLGLESNYDFRGYKPLDEVGRVISGSDVALAITGGDKYEPTTKIFDYMACNTPILGVGPADGEMARMVSSFTNGHVVAENDSALIYEVLESIADERPALLGSKTEINRHTRKARTERLVEILNTTI